MLFLEVQLVCSGFSFQVLLVLLVLLLVLVQLVVGVKVTLCAGAGAGVVGIVGWLKAASIRVYFTNIILFKKSKNSSSIYN